MNIKEKIGQRIRQIREQKKMTQKELSDLADLDRSYITSVENGQRNISIINLEKLANALGVSLCKLFEEL
ncbi:MAG TPA: helix-turn-helix transcriptional regulator [Bacilli bacterium]|jgi:transcriptional regulator with XRE-family HTH domain|nr:helix-turn-helix transcriptional regulator [Bacilli bacterium]